MTVSLATQTISAIDPATGEVFAETPATPVEALPRMMAEARAAQREWAARSLSERKRVILRFQRLFFEHRMETAELVARENGKPVAEALLTDVAVTLDMARYYLAKAGRSCDPAESGTATSRSSAGRAGCTTNRLGLSPSSRRGTTRCCCRSAK